MKGQIILEKGNTVVELELFDDVAPNTVANFKKLANKGFYNGLTFHRVIPGFVAQGGSHDGSGGPGPEPTIKCEALGNPKKHEVGTLSMAHAGPNTGSTQFFICYDALPHLDEKHTIFGKVVSNMDKVFAIKQGDKIKEILI